MINFVFKLRLFLWGLFFLAVLFLLYMSVVPGGKITYSHNFTKKNAFIGELTPKDRLNDDAKSIIGDPVYFSLSTPRAFTKAKMTLKYKRLGNLTAPIIESGALVDGKSWRYDLKPVENRLIDDLMKNFRVIRENDVVLLQKADVSAATKNYSSISEFLLNPPAPKEIALYNYDLNTDYILEDYASSDSVNKIIYPLRGAYQFYTYLKDEELNFNFSFSDLNKNRDEDNVDVFVYYRNEIIDRKHLDDDGNLKDDGKSGEARRLDFKIPDLPEGVYKIEIKANDDIVTEKIETNQQKISFINNIWLFDKGSENIILYSDSKVLNVKTVSPASLQKINFRGEILDLNETYKQFGVVSASTSKQVLLQKDGLIISGSGVFSFSEDALVNPAYKKVDSNMNVDSDGINYILARYSAPKEDGEWRTAELEFDLGGAYRENGKYNFVISIPGLLVEEGQKEGIEISEIKFDLSGTSLLEFFKRR